MTYKQFEQIYQNFQNAQQAIKVANSTDNIFKIMNLLLAKLPNRWANFIENTPLAEFGDLQDHFIDTLDDAKYQLQQETQYFVHYNLKNVISVQAWKQFLNYQNQAFKYQYPHTIGAF